MSSDENLTIEYVKSTRDKINKICVYLNKRQKRKYFFAILKYVVDMMVAWELY